MTVAGVGVGGGKREVVVGQTVGGVIVPLSRDLERRAQHSRGFETGGRIEINKRRKKQSKLKIPATILSLGSKDLPVAAVRCGTRPGGSGMPMSGHGEAAAEKPRRIAVVEVRKMSERSSTVRRAGEDPKMRRRIARLRTLTALWFGWK